MIPLLLLLQSTPLAPANTPRPTHDALHYNIELSVAAEAGQPKDISAVTTTRWRVLSPDSFRIELDSGYTLSEVLVNGSPVRGWRRRRDVITIPHALKVGDTATTALRYSGVPHDGLVVKDSAGRRTVFADNWPNRAHRWFPSQDYPSDKASVEFEIKVSPRAQVIANGVLVKKDTTRSGDVIWHYRMDRPIPVYTMVVGIATMTRTSMGEGGCAVRCIPLEVWTYPQDSGYAVAGPFRRVKSILDYFTDVVGEFPYARLAHVQSSTIFGGMENSTVIFYDEDAYRTRKLSEGTVAHETAHQWFGDAVTERDWPHLWLSEGFATYFAALWAAHADGDSAFQASMSGAARAVFGSASTNQPIVDSADNLLQLLNTNNYKKGSWVLHSLRGLIGDSAFFAGIRKYYHDFRDSTALSEDFQREMEAASGKELGWYFQQALHQPGYPKLDIVSHFDSASRTFGLIIRQTQAESWGIYRLPGFELFIDGLLVQIDIEGRETRFISQQFSTPPKSIIADPNGWWLAEYSVTGDK